MPLHMAQFPLKANMTHMFTHIALWNVPEGGRATARLAYHSAIGQR